MSLEIAQQSLVLTAQVASNHDFFNLLALERSLCCYKMVIFLQVFIRFEPVVSEDDPTFLLWGLRRLFVLLYFTQSFCQFRLVGFIKQCIQTLLIHSRQVDSRLRSQNFLDFWSVLGEDSPVFIILDGVSGEVEGKAVRVLTRIEVC